jgi:hypothetical protein
MDVLNHVQKVRERSRIPKRATVRIAVAAPARIEVDVTEAMSFEPGRERASDCARIFCSLITGLEGNPGLLAERMLLSPSYLSAYIFYEPMMTAVKNRSAFPNLHLDMQTSSGSQSTPNMRIMYQSFSKDISSMRSCFWGSTRRFWRNY